MNAKFNTTINGRFKRAHHSGTFRPHEYIPVLIAPKEGMGNKI
jgi:hypothetical protein